MSRAVITSADAENNSYTVEVPGIIADRSPVQIPAQCITKDVLTVGTEVNIVDINNQSPESALGFEGILRLLPNTGQFVYSTDKIWKSFDEIYQTSPNSAAYGFLYSSALNRRWQKDCPLYTFGNVTEIIDQKTLKVTAQMPYLKYYEWPVLTCRTDYMTCNTGAFKIGDIAVIKFENSDINQPVCVGFWIDPQDCAIPFHIRFIRLMDDLYLTNIDDKNLAISLYVGTNAAQTKKEIAVTWSEELSLWVVEVLNPDQANLDYWIEATCDNGVSSILSLGNTNNARMDKIFDVNDQVPIGKQDEPVEEYDVNILSLKLMIRLVRGDGTKVTPSLNPVITFTPYPGITPLPVIQQTYDSISDIWTIYYSPDGVADTANVTGFLKYVCDDGIETQYPYKYKTADKSNPVNLITFNNDEYTMFDQIPYWKVENLDYDTTPGLPWSYPDYYATEEEWIEGATSRDQINRFFSDYHCAPLNITFDSYIWSRNKIGDWQLHFYYVNSIPRITQRVVKIYSSIPYRTRMELSDDGYALQYVHYEWLSDIFPPPCPNAEFSSDVGTLGYYKDGVLQPGSITGLKCAELSLDPPVDRELFFVYPTNDTFINSPKISGAVHSIIYDLNPTELGVCYARAANITDIEWDY